MKNYFPLSEFIQASSGIPNDYQIIEASKKSKAVDSRSFWRNTLNPIRDMLGFAISITDWLRLHKEFETSRSQHYALEEWSVNGAVDIRPTDKTNKDHFLRLGMMLAADPKIKRVCYYSPSERFTWGGFHCDCQGDTKQLFINSGKEIDWKHVDVVEFVKTISETK